MVNAPCSLHQIRQILQQGLAAHNHQIPLLQGHIRNLLKSLLLLLKSLRVEPEMPLL